MKNSLTIISSSMLILSCLCISACTPNDDTRPAESISKPDSTVVMSAGRELITEAFAAISNALGTAMTAGGIPHAIEYCNLNAIALTDSVSKEYGVEISRASHKPRNPRNRANEEELESIQAYIQKLQDGSELSPRIIYGSEMVTFHAPLQMVAYTCLSCHGDKTEDIREQDLTVIDQHYPDDEATGFELDELRGIWSVKFPYTYFSE